jgi:hypothetical protein
VQQEPRHVIGDSACECVTSESMPEHYGQWVTVFRVMAAGAGQQHYVSVFSGMDDPGFIVGRRYRLEVRPVLLTE